MAKRKGKEFIFPDNVESGYNLIKGVTVKSFFTVLLPFILVGILIILIPPYTLLSFMIKVFVALIIITLGLAVTVSRPIKSRENITFIQHVNFLRRYRKRQKLFYLEPKERKENKIDK